jgi:hypothetical protein
VEPGSAGLGKAWVVQRGMAGLALARRGEAGMISGLGTDRLGQVRRCKEGQEKGRGLLPGLCMLEYVSLSVICQ